MSVRVYSNYLEFSEQEEESNFILNVHFLEENKKYEYWGSNFESPQDYEDDHIKFSDPIREDYNFYVICEDEDLDLAEEIANTLGKYSKINLQEINKTFFSVV